jgi:hypothetical protein
MPPPALRAALALALSLSPALTTAQTRAPVVTEQPVDGSAIRRVQAETVIVAPFSAVVARVLDYEHYPEFMQRFRTARVVRRNRGATDVYFQLELPRAMGIVWFLHRMTVVSRTPDRVEIAGVAQSGNVGSVESRVIVERLPGAHESARLTFELYGSPVVPVLPDTVNDTLRHAVRWASVLLQGHVERSANAARPRH